MADEDDSFELVAEVVQTGIETLEALNDGLSVPGVDMGVGLIRRAMQARQAEKAKEFFRRLAVATGSNDADTLMTEIAKSINERWAQEAIDRGYRLMMSTVDDAARPCIAVLVAEYLIEGKKSPDRVFQHVGALLADAVQRDLFLLRGFCDCVRQLPSAGGGNRTFLLRGSEISLAVVVDQERGVFRTKTFTGFDSGEGAVSLLSRYGFGQVPSAAGPDDPASRAIFAFSPRHDHKYLVLGRCLTALVEPVGEASEGL